MSKAARLYLDHAATSFPKPPGVVQAVQRYLVEVGASAGRGAYREAMAAGRILDACRLNLARLLDAGDPARIAFTFNASDALNLAIKGVVRQGDHVVTTWMDHNSVLRPLRKLEERGVATVTRVRADADGLVDPAAVAAACRPDTRLVAVVHASNVCGALEPVAEIAARAHERGALVLVDGAQTVGARPVLPRELGADLLAFPGHKALMGPLGTGGLYVREGLELDTLREGGTGSRSEEDRQPGAPPDRYEAGSHNLPGIAGLGAAVEQLLALGLDEVARRKRALTAAFLERTRGVPGLEVRGPADPDRREPVFPVAVEGLDPHELAALLDAEFGICSRAGLHCAPLAHRTLGTFPAGSVRLSFGVFQSEADVERAAAALARVAASVSAA